MFKTLEQKLKDASILDVNEPILSFIQVVDFLKQQQQFKKIVKEELAGILPNSKQFYFLATSNVLCFRTLPKIFWNLLS